MNNDFELRFIRNFTEKRMAHPGSTVMVAFSGGIDSTVLLTVLSEVKNKLGVTICAAHLNHMLRGEEADRDENFCINVCASLGIELVIDRKDVRQYASQHKKSIEAAGRDVRYDFLARSAAGFNADTVLTAHNANDNAETVIFNLIRGTSARGLCGIPEKRDIFARPLLIFTRAQIKAYADEKALVWTEDSTNTCTDYTRNYIRRVILPDMERINPRTVEAINRLSSSMKSDSFAADELINGFLKYSEAQLSFTHISSMKKALECNGKGRLSLPDKVYFLYDGGKYAFSGNLPEEHTLIEKQFLSEGENIVDGCGMIFIGTDAPPGSDMSFFADVNKLDGKLCVRSRAEGDRFISKNITRSVKKCFIDKKIPRGERAAIPIICDGSGIIYVPYIGLADRVKPYGDSETKKISIYIRKANSNQ